MVKVNGVKVCVGAHSGLEIGSQQVGSDNGSHGCRLASASTPFSAFTDTSSKLDDASSEDSSPGLVPPQVNANLK